jgi:hypothetical protein
MAHGGLYAVTSPSTGACMPLPHPIPALVIGLEPPATPRLITGAFNPQVTDKGKGATGGMTTTGHPGAGTSTLHCTYDDVEAGA